jgi:predicted permease
MSFLERWFRRGNWEREMRDELRFHIDQQTVANIAAGMPREEAWRQALLQFGGSEAIKEDCREQRSGFWLDTLLADARFALRMLRKNPGFTAVAVLTLALGIGATTAVFSVVNAILLKPLPYPNSDKIVMLWWKAPISSAQFDADRFPWGKRDFLHVSQSSKAFQSLGAFKSDFFNFAGSGEPVRLDGLRASAGFFAALGVVPALGRTFTPEEDQPGREFEVILSAQLWRDRFGADPGILGRAITLNSASYTVVGVMPRGFSFPHAEEMPAVLSFPPRIQLWVPLDIPAAPRGPQDLAVIGRLNPGVARAQATAELRLYGDRMEKDFPGTGAWYNPNLVPLAQQVVGDTRRPLLLILAAVGVVLLIASSNVVSLLLTRSLGRKREFTLRSALGAGRRRLIRQLLTESLLLAVIGGVAGILLAEAELYSVRIFGPSNIPRLHDVALDPRVFIFAIAITLAAGILSGLAPALASSRQNLVESLKESGQRSGSGAAHSKLRNALLVSEVALALVLEISAMLLVRTFHRMLEADAGFNPTRVLTFQLSLPNAKYKETDRMAELYQKALRALQSLPGVQAAGLVSEVPMGGSTDSTVIRVPDHPHANDKDHPYANYSFASPGYFSAIGTPLLRGRDFGDTDTTGSMLVTIINSAMAQKYWPGQDPIGRQVGVEDTRWATRTVIGIVADIKHNSLRDEPVPEMYVPYTQNEIKIWPSMQTMQVALRTKADPAALTASVREALRSVDADLPVANVATLAALIDDSMAQPRFSLFLMGSFGGLALALAMIGMYGVISYSVQQRTQEIGIRMALGASRGALLRMVLGLGAQLAAVGIAIGLLVSRMVTRTMESFLYQVRPTDPLTFATVSIALMCVALAACYIPARRAMRVDPMTALRYE